MATVKNVKTVKTLHRVDLPGMEHSWHTLSIEDEAIMLEKLIRLIKPIGLTRYEGACSSKGKGRKRKVSAIAVDGDQETSRECSSLAAPNALQSLTVGFNSTVRTLDSLAQWKVIAAPSTKPDGRGILSASAGMLVLVCTSALPVVMTAPLPALAAAASAGCHPENAIRLISVSGKAESRIAEVMKQPMVNVLGVQSRSPETDDLNDFLINRLGPVALPTLTKPSYIPVNVQTVEIAPHKRGKPLKKNGKHEVKS